MDPEQEDYEDIAEEEEVIPEPTKIQPKKVVNKKKAMETKTEVPVEEAPESRYTAYRVQAQKGIMDTETNVPVGNEVYVVLAEILNKLNNIEISQS